MVALAEEKTETGASSDDPFEIAKQALMLMARQGVPPVPVNFSVWYHHVAGDKPDLSKEVDALISASAAGLDEAANQALYIKYIASAEPEDNSAAKDAKLVEDTAEDAQKMMAELMSTIMNFSGEASSYEAQMGGHIQEMGDMNTPEEMKAMMQQFLDTAMAMKEGSAGLNAKLEESKKEIERLRGNLEEVKKESEKDFLTGIFNRKALDKRLAQEMEVSAAEKTPLCFLIMDIDHFKKFNDTYGHQIGDQVLKIVAQSLLASVKGSDIVARYGGEEFCVILPNTPIGGAVAVAESIRKAIASKELKRRDTGENYGQITMSVGVAMYRVDEESMEGFVKRADDALYKSKQDGRNRVTMEAA